MDTPIAGIGWRGNQIWGIPSVWSVRSVWSIWSIGGRGSGTDHGSGDVERGVELGVAEVDVRARLPPPKPGSLRAVSLTASGNNANCSPAN
eukprot:838621-Rhodomonas_salina.1